MKDIYCTRLKNIPEEDVPSSDRDHYICDITKTQCIALDINWSGGGSPKFVYSQQNAFMHCPAYGVSDQVAELIRKELSAQGEKIRAENQTN